jgi:putative lipoic acid-binding regulatory protein
MDAKDGNPIIAYPCSWTYKVIGRDREALEKVIAEVVGGSEHTVALSRSSTGGSYHCRNLTVTVETEAARLDLYQRLCRHSAVICVM